MTHIRRPKQPQDDIRADLWSIAFLSSVGGGRKAGGAMAVFDLFNRLTGRAHRMAIEAGGTWKGLPVGVSIRDTGYIKFKTKVPASFADFHRKRAKLELKDRLGFSWRSVKVFQSGGVDELMSAEVNNWNPTGYNKFTGQGLTEVYYSDGKPVGDPEYLLQVEVPTHEELPIGFKLTVTDFGLVIRMPEHALFDFDRDVLHYEAAQNVSRMMHYINALPADYVRIAVEGHTDSREKVPGYNMALSRRRAQAVLAYFERYKWAFDRAYAFEPPRGLGATKPVAPNKHADGSDNPEGRAQNRRVEVYLYKH
jgi:outer membrane protein OmpA-like peptidoglycan-associated protein